MVIHQRTHPALDNAGCFGCKIASISFGTVPGGAKDAMNGTSSLRQQEKDLNRYREKRRAGEQPEGTTRKAMARSEHKMALWERHEKSITDNNPPEAVSQTKRALLNQA